MDVRPRVSVIVPAYNAERYVGRCLDSLRAQTLGDIEILCVDNGSSDGSRAVLAEHAAADGRVRVLDEPTPGVSAARNAGLAAARGEFVAFADADDFADERYLELLVEKAQAERAAMTICGFDEFSAADGGAGAFVPREICPESSLYGRAFSLEDAPCLSVHIVTPNVWRILFDRGFVEENALRFPEGLRTAEDLVFIYRALFRAPRIALVPQRLYHYRRDASGSLTRQDRGGDAARALKLVRDDLDAVGATPARMRHVANLVLDTFDYALFSAAGLAEFEGLVQSYRIDWESRIAQAGDVVEGRYVEVQRALKSPAADQLFARYAGMRAETERLNAEVARLAQELADERARAQEAASRCAEVEGSHAFRIGSALTFLPSKAKARLSRRADAKRARRADDADAKCADGAEK